MQLHRPLAYLFLTLKALSLKNISTPVPGSSQLIFRRTAVYIATGDRDGLIQLWNTTTWQESGTPYSGHTHAILDLAFSSDGTKLASVALDNTLIEWELSSTDSQKLVQAEAPGGLTAVAYSTDNTHIITGGNDFQLKIWDAGNLTVLKTKAFSGKVVDIASIKESSLFVIGGSDQKVALLDISGDMVLTEVGELLYPLTSVAVSPDGKLIAAGDLNSGITVWDIADGKFKEPRKIKNDPPENSGDLNAPGSIHSVAFSPDGKLIFSGLHNGTIRSLNVGTEEVQQNQFLNAHVKNLAVSHDSQYLVTQQDNNVLTIWDLWRGTALYQLQGEIKPGDPFAQDDSMLAVASVGPGPSTVNVYNPLNGKEIYKFNSYRICKLFNS